MYNYFVAFGCLGQKSRIPELQLKKLYFCAPFEKMGKPLITLLWGRFIFVKRRFLKRLYKSKYWIKPL